MIGHAIAASLPRLRAQAESLMRDSASIERPSGTTTNPDNGAIVTAWATVASAVPARILRTQQQERDIATAGQTLTQLSVEGRFPTAISDLRLGDRITLVSDDARLSGVPLIVVEVEHATHAVARRWRAVSDEDRQL